MEKLKSKMQFKRGVLHNYSIQQIVTIFALSFCLIFLSATAVFGINGQQNPSSIANLNVDDETKTATEAQEQSNDISKDLNTDPVDVIATPNADDFFTVNWYDTVKSQGVDHSTTSKVHYGYITTSQSGVKTFNSLPEPFQTESITIDFTNTNFGNAYASVFDVRHFEETFTDSNTGKTWAFCDCYFGAPTDTKAIHVSKVGAHWSVSGGAINWYYRNDFTSSSSSSTKIETLPDSTDIYVIFKDAYESFPETSMLDIVDNQINWKSDYSHTPTCLVQYLYSDGVPTHGVNIKKMDPALAADLTVEANKEIYGKNYCGRSVDTHERDASGVLTENVYTCVYNSVYINWILYNEGVPQYSSDFVEADAFRYYETNDAHYWQYHKPADEKDVWTILTYKDSAGTQRNCTDADHSYLIASFIYDCSLNIDTSNFRSKRIEGVDTLSKDVTINVYDYDAFYDNSNSEFLAQINDDHEFKFGSGSTGDFGSGYSLSSGYDIGYWYWRSDSGTKNRDYVNNPYIWENKLFDGKYPLLRRNMRTNYSGYGYLSYLPVPPGTSLAEPLGYLWGFENNPYVKQYKNLNYLFSKPYYDQTGYYYYNSEDSFAQLRKKRDATSNTNASNGFGSESNSFILYTEHEDVGNGVPQFMPFDDKNNTNSSNRDYSFGMNIECNFIMPENGKVVHQGVENDMTFEFSGDDDEFVYIDNALCMDLGGIHGILHGTINFATGEVVQSWCDTSDAEDTRWKTFTLFDLYADAGIIDPNLEDSWSKYFVCYQGTKGTENAKYRFINYSVHNLKFYYMERGAGGSNCKIKFNLQPLPANSLIVEKQLDKSGLDTDDIVFEGNFHYKAEVQKFDQSTGGYSGDWEPYGLTPIGTDEAGQLVYPTYDVYEYDQYGQAILIRTNQEISRDLTDPYYGMFYIEDKQYAVLNGYNANDLFRVVECDPYKTIQSTDREGYLDYSVLWSVLIQYLGSTTWEEPDKITLEDETTWYGADQLKLGYENQNKVTFKNTPNPESLIDLRIQKDGDDHKSSAIYIGFNGSTNVINPETGRDDSQPLTKTYDVYSLDGTLVESGKTPENGAITLDTGQYALIKEVQMRTPVTAIVVKELESTLDQKYKIEEWDGSSNWIPGLMTNPWPAAITAYEDQATEVVPHTLLYNASLPSVLFTIETPASDKYGQINFSVIDNEEPPVPTALTIFKNPELWTFLFAAILILLVAGPISIIHKYRLSRRSVNLPTLNLHTTFFNI